MSITLQIFKEDKGANSRSNLKKFLIGALTASLIAIGSVGGGFTAVQAAVQCPNNAGGNWDYGTDGPTIWSNFYHGSRSHGSSVKNWAGNLTRSPNVMKGSWANSTRNDGAKGKIDYAYCRVV